MEYSIVIPVYNESDKISSTLTQVMGFMKSFSEKFEIVVVDDGSEDDTVSVVKDYAKSNKEIRLIENSHKGKGPTIWTGIMKAKGKYIYMCDADLATPISELKKLSLWIKEHDYDIVIASREGAGAVRINEPFYRHFMGRIFNYWVRLIALPGIIDSQCGFKLFKGGVAKDVFGLLKIYGEDSKEIKKPYMGAFDVEVLYLSLKSGYKIKSLPVTWTFVKTSRLNPIADSISMAKDVLKIRINDLRGVYKRSIY